MADSPITTPQEELHCDYSKCSLGIISKGPIAYDEKHREIYHQEVCPNLAAYDRTSRSGKSEFVRLNYIGMSDALKLLRDGKLAQSKGLEKKVEK